LRVSIWSGWVRCWQSSSNRNEEAL
jgi:hypothetical protein